VIPQRLSIVTLGVESLRRAKRFYLEGLGWSEVDQPSDGIVFIQMPGMVLALYPHHALADDIGIPAPAGAGGYTGIVFWGGYSGYFRDPDGHLWEVAHNPFTEPGMDGSFWMT